MTDFEQIEDAVDYMTLGAILAWTVKKGIVETKWVNAASCRMGRKKIKMHRLADLRHSGQFSLLGFARAAFLPL